MKRWLLWTFRCRRGRRCAHLVLEPEGSQVPVGAVLVADYVCGACGTRYVHTLEPAGTPEDELSRLG